MRLCRVFAAIFAIAFKRELAFRTNLVLNGLQAVIMTGAGLVTVGVLFRHTQELGGWTLDQMLVLLGTFQVLSGVLATFIEPNMRWFANRVLAGDLDDTLLKPVSSLFLASLGSHAPFGLVQAIPGVALVILGQRDIDVTPPLWNIVGWLMLVAVGVAVTWATRVALALISLWAPALSLDVVYDAVWQFARYPVSIYEQPLRFALSWVVPLVFISTMPARALTDGVSGVVMLAGIGIGIVSVAAVRVAWTFGLRRYTSATS